MKRLTKCLAAVALLGLLAGMIALVLGEIPIAGIIWAATAVLSFIAYDIAKAVKKRSK